MPDLKDVYEFTQEDVFLKLTMQPRPETVNVRTVEGTKEKLKELVNAGFGASMSEAAHLCLQIGLMAFEGKIEDG